MSDNCGGANERILVIGESARTIAFQSCQIDSAVNGREGAIRIGRARKENRPFALAFIDMQLPSDWDGIETAAKIWSQDPNVQIVICAACAAHSRKEIHARLEHTGRLAILRTPIDDSEALQLAETLMEKWRLTRQVAERLSDLERMIQERTRELAVTSQHERDMQSAQAQRRTALEHGMRHALDAGEFTVQYQPLVDIATRRAVSLEALLRWQHPKLGWIPPGKFIPAAEESGLIVPIGEFVLRTVCEQVMQWERENVPVVPVAVNVSAVQFQRQPMHEFVRGILRETGMQPQQLALEITEGVLMKDPQHHAAVLQRLRADGVRIQIDDFGTGYSSLSYLRHLPIDTLKIDRSFVSQIDTSRSDEAIVSAILAMARSLGLRAVAEGVETPAQLQVLGKHGCELAQGYFFSRPLPAADCGKLLLELAQRVSFTDTLRMKLISRERGAPPQLEVIRSRRR